MAQKPKHPTQKKGDKTKFISKEELQNMKLNISIEVPKEDFDRLLKVMMGEK